MKKFFLLTAFLILFFSGGMPALAGGPGGGVTGVDTNLKIIRMITTHPVNTVRFSPDDSYIISSGGSTDMKIYNSQTGDVIDTIESGTEEIFTGFIFSRSGRFLVAKTSKQIYVYDAKTFVLLKTLKDTASYYNMKLIDISMDDSFVAMASAQNFYTVWEWQTGRVVKRQEFPLVTPNGTYEKCYIDEIKYSLNGKYLGIYGAYTYTKNNQNYSVPIYTVLNIGSWDTTSSGFANGYISKSGKLTCVYNTSSSTLKIRDVASGALIQQIHVIASNAKYCISTNDKYVVFCDHDGGVTYTYKIENGELIGKYGNSKDGWYGFSNLSTPLSDKMIMCSIGDHIYLLTPPWETMGITTKPDAPTILYPNPTSGDITVELVLNTPTMLSASFIDAKGSLAKKQNLGLRETGKIQIGTMGILPGAYTLQINGPGYSKTFRLMVVR